MPADISALLHLLLQVAHLQEVWVFRREDQRDTGDEEDKAASSEHGQHGEKELNKPEHPCCRSILESDPRGDAQDGDGNEAEREDDGWPANRVKLKPFHFLTHSFGTLAAFAAVFAGGVAFALLREWSGRLAAPLAAHAAFNATILLGLGLAPRDP